MLCVSALSLAFQSMRCVCLLASLRLNSVELLLTRLDTAASVTLHVILTHLVAQWIPKAITGAHDLCDSQEQMMSKHDIQSQLEA